MRIEALGGDCSGQLPFFNLKPHICSHTNIFLMEAPNALYAWDAVGVGSGLGGFGVRASGLRLQVLRAAPRAARKT